MHINHDLPEAVRHILLKSPEDQFHPLYFFDKDKHLCAESVAGWPPRGNDPI
jgi:hypothetical protein